VSVLVPPPQSAVARLSPSGLVDEVLLLSREDLIATFYPGM